MPGGASPPRYVSAKVGMTMSEMSLSKNPNRMTRHDTALIVVDIQEKLVPAMADGAKIVWNVRRLLDAAKVLGLPVLGTEQYTQGLGSTVPEIASRLGPVSSKLAFSCCGCPAFLQTLSDLRQKGISQVLLCGIEAHVCVAQTAFDLLADGWHVFLAADAVGSRFDIDCRVALQRMVSAGVTITTTEAAMFEWCEVAGTPEFKQIGRLAREPSPVVG